VSQNSNTLAGLLVAVLAVSGSAIFVRWAPEVPAIMIAFYRMAWSSGLVAGVAVFRGEIGDLRRITGKDRALMALAGFLLALHFATWIGSLKITTVAHSLTLGATQPVFSVALSPLLLRESGERRGVIAALLTLAGVAIIAGMDLHLNPEMILGDALALSSALFITLYLFVARGMRHRINLIPYLMAVYGSAALCLGLSGLLLGEELVDYPARAHLMLVLLALIPTGIGHSLLNWAARRIEAFKVNIAGLGEPILASLLAYFIFGEAPAPAFYLGAVLILTGIYIALRKPD